MIRVWKTSNYSREGEELPLQYCIFVSNLGRNAEAVDYPVELLLHLWVVLLLSLRRAGVQEVVLNGYLGDEVLEPSRRLHEVVLF